MYFGRHVVKNGETLYSIARRYGRELKALAKRNNIHAPYIIKPGQKINLERLEGEITQASKTTKAAGRRKTNVTKGKESVRIGKKVTKKQKHTSVSKIKWQWPHVGPILAKYSSNAKRRVGQSANLALSQGIDIAGQLGAPIFAAADGEVVYVGNGLLGYGNLVIINHNETYLSAYAHNKSVFVQEGQKVKRGKKITEMGVSEKKQVLLHFQIRRDGQPVDPLKYLPKR